MKMINNKFGIITILLNNVHNLHHAKIFMFKINNM